MDTRVGNFLEPLNSNDQFFSHIPILHLATNCILFVGDVTESEVDVYSQ